MKKDTILGIVFLIWFLGSFVGMIVISATEFAWLMPAFFSQFFLVVGIVMIIDTKKKGRFSGTDYLFCIPLLVGVGGIVYCFLKRFASKEFWDACASVLLPILPYVALSVFVIMGIFMLVVAYKKTISIRKICTHEVEAMCIDVKMEYRNKDGRQRMQPLYSPVFEFYYKSQEYHVCNNIFSNKKYEVGDYYYINIDPMNPTYFYVVKENLKIGLVLFFLGAACLYLPLSLIVKEILSRF